MFYTPVVMTIVSFGNMIVRSLMVKSIEYAKSIQKSIGYAKILY